ncbi:hypothetical protein AGMMS49992_04710 [Clostridia bacterium]|nr:hypothetical protein AGMMS49992_04710 [Clostridia bacterium]
MSFPRTTVGGVSLPRMLIGSNWILGYSHTSSSADGMIRARYSQGEKVAELLEVYLEHDIDALMAPMTTHPALMDGVRIAQERTGKPITLIDTPILDLHDSTAARQSVNEVLDKSQALGCKFCLIHHSSAEQLVSKLHGTMDRLPDYLDMIRQHGMIPGLSAHMPELIVYSDQNGYDVETYIQIYNCMGFLMQVEIEGVHRIIHNAKKPVMTIKPMAAGRTSPFVGLTFSFSTIREKDMVTCGAFTPDEAREDIEIALAAIERRPPDLEGRSSPNQNTAALSGK